MKPFELVGLPPDEINAFLAATHSDPFRVLGPHRVGDDLAIRVFRPDAEKIEVVLDRLLRQRRCPSKERGAAAEAPPGTPIKFPPPLLRLFCPTGSYRDFSKFRS